MGVAPEEKISASKVVAFIGMLATFALAINFFANFSFFTPLYPLWGIICIALAVVLFISIELISFGPLKIPYLWWILLIIGGVLIVLAYFFINDYLPGILILMAAFMDLILENKTFKASKFVAIVGASLAIYECVALILSAIIFPWSPPWLAVLWLNAIVGIALMVILFLLIFEVVDFKIFDYSWWVVLTIGFVIFTWVSPIAAAFSIPVLPVLGYGGIIILIAFILILMGF